MGLRMVETHRSFGMPNTPNGWKKTGSVQGCDVVAVDCLQSPMKDAANYARQTRVRDVAYRSCQSQGDMCRELDTFAPSETRGCGSEHRQDHLRTNRLR